MLRVWNPAGVAEPTGRFHHVVTVPAGAELAFVSGQVGLYLDGRPVDPDPTAQTRQIFENLGVIVRELGATPADIVKFTILVVGPDGLAGFRTAREVVFADWYPDGGEPASTLMMVVALAAPEFLVEIEAIVAVPST